MLRILHLSFDQINSSSKGCFLSNQGCTVFLSIAWNLDHLDGIIKSQDFLAFLLIFRDSKTELSMHLEIVWVFFTFLKLTENYARASSNWALNVVATKGRNGVHPSVLCRVFDFYTDEQTRGGTIKPLYFSRQQSMLESKRNQDTCSICILNGK